MAGPAAVRVNADVSSSEAVVAVLPAGSWDNQLGCLLRFTGSLDGTSAGGLATFRVRQGDQVDSPVAGSVSLPFGTSATPVPFAVVDDSPYGRRQAGGRYCLTANALNPGTLTGVLTHETIAPVM